VTAVIEACRAAFARRLVRAGRLAIERRPCAEVLTFYADLAARQRDLLPNAVLLLRTGVDRGTFATALDIGAVAVLVPPFVDGLRASAPTRVGETLAPLACLTPSDWQPVCADLWRNAGSSDAARSAPEVFVAEAVLQPFAEFWAADTTGPSTAGADATRCRRCGGRAVVGTLREVGHGAGRGLQCGLCASQWTIPRVVCPACGETRVDALPVFRDGDLPAVRLDACDTCRVYIKTVDLTIDGRLDPIVDDLATPALDLWAEGEGYHRLRPNLLRL
jgi:formate dehydrogenase accessory protein FdhE